MDFQELHAWDVDQPEAIVIQNKLRRQIQIRQLDKVVEKIGGIDIAFDQKSNLLIAGVCVFSYPRLRLIEQKTGSAMASFPYVPGLQAFREGSVVLKAFRELETSPDLIIYSGHGIAHPRKFGLASHMGLITGIPSIGCARKKLVGVFHDPGIRRGSYSDLLYDNVPVGIVYRSREEFNPIFISPGHLCDINGAREIVARCVSRYRMPEPLRAAHRLAGKRKRNHNF
ncbi:MAG: endonuclease V [Candidatus Zixiibacteriota bacterium]